MTRLVVDTSGYLIAATASHPQQARVLDVLERAELPPIVSPLVMAEIDYLVLDKAGVSHELDVINDLVSGAYEVSDLTLTDLCAARDVVARYRDLKVGLTDAVNVVLADRYRTNELLTTDQRHFRAIAPLTKRFASFRLLPADL